MTIPLLEALQLAFPDSSKRTLRQWIKWKRVLVDGQPATDLFVSKQAHIELIKKQTCPLTVLYSDKDLIAIDKPAGLLSVPSESEPFSALAILRLHYPHNEIYAAHRLDQSASGVLLFVKSMKMRELMAEKFGAHDLIRQYHAIVEGRVSQKEGEWSFPLLELDNFQVVVSEDGRSAKTRFTCLRRTPRFTHLSIELETGRKHQIRVHSSHVGHPIIGDKRYGSTADPIKRLGLHAKRLAFSHPVTHKWIEISAALPKEFEVLGASLSKQS